MYIICTYPGFRVAGFACNNYSVCECTARGLPLSVNVSVCKITWTHDCHCLLKSLSLSLSLSLCVCVQFLAASYGWETKVKLHGFISCSESLLTTESQKWQSRTYPSWANKLQDVVYKSYHTTSNLKVCFSKVLELPSGWNCETCRW